jgi:hypothetical protein
MRACPTNKTFTFLAWTASASFWTTASIRGFINGLQIAHSSSCLNAFQGMHLVVRCRRTTRVRQIATFGWDNTNKPNPTYIICCLVLLLVSFNVPSGGTFRSRTAHFMPFIRRILIHSNPINLVLWWIDHILEHITETFRKSTSVLPSGGSTVVCFTGTESRTSVWETPLLRNRSIEEYIHGFGRNFRSFVVEMCIG